MSTTTSRDGTTIAYEQSGTGPALILIDGALAHRALWGGNDLAALLAPHFTVYTYDRRGRGESNDTAPYAVEREVEDIAALIVAAGGTAGLYGMSSGGALALEAAASGLPVSKLAVYEVPYTVDGGDDPREKEAYDKQLADLLAAGDRSGAAALFLSFALPPEVVSELRTSPAWPQYEAAAGTLGYDTAIMGDGRVPRDRARKVTVPTLVMDGGDSPDALRIPAGILADAVPDGTRLTLPGQTHAVAAEALAPVLIDFFSDNSTVER